MGLLICSYFIFSVFCDVVLSVIFDLSVSPLFRPWVSCTKSQCYNHFHYPCACVNARSSDQARIEVIVPSSVFMNDCVATQVAHKRSLVDLRGCICRYCSVPWIQIGPIAQKT